MRNGITVLITAFFSVICLSVVCQGQQKEAAVAGTQIQQRNAVAPKQGNAGEKCSVAGFVVNASTGASLNKATVRLHRLALNAGASGGVTIVGGGSPSADTDASGHFEIGDIDPGDYAMSVSRNGYAIQTRGTNGSANPASRITLAAGAAVTDLRFNLTPQAVIMGKVVDEEGEPLAYATVGVFARHGAPGRDHFMSNGQAETDDLGQYRVFGIAPGQYFVKATLRRDPSNYRPATAKLKSEITYVPTYYPGTTEASAAVPVHVIGGQEVEVDLALRKTATVHLAGKLLNNRPNTHAVITAIPSGGPTWDSDERHYAMASGDGKWIMTGLLPGSYTLVCDNLEDGVRLGARLPIDVQTKNINDVQLTLQRYPDLFGKVTVEGGGQSFTQLKVELHPRQALASLGYGGSRPKSDGTFLLEATSPDLSDVTVSNLPNGYFLKSITLNGREVSDTGVELGLGGNGPAKVEILISPNGATLEGIISDARDQPEDGATAVLVPDSERRHAQSSFYAATTDQKGHFKVTGIRPGEYKVVARESLNSSEYGAPETLEAADKEGQTVTLEEGQQKAVELKAD
jgi:hypothetical protein